MMKKIKKYYLIETICILAILIASFICGRGSIDIPVCEVNNDYIATSSAIIDCNLAELENNSIYFYNDGIVVTKLDGWEQVGQFCG